MIYFRSLFANNHVIKQYLIGLVSIFSLDTDSRFWSKRDQSLHASFLSPLYCLHSHTLLISIPRPGLMFECFPPTYNLFNKLVVSAFQDTDLATSTTNASAQLLVRDKLEPRN